MVAIAKPATESLYDAMDALVDAIDRRRPRNLDGRLGRLEDSDGYDMRLEIDAGSIVASVVDSDGRTSVIADEPEYVTLTAVEAYDAAARIDALDGGARNLETIRLAVWGWL